jgi:acyl carrier protein
MSSQRPREDKAWDYMRIIPSAIPYIWMKPTADKTCELIVLNGLKSKNESNSDDPPNSFYTRDLFIQHPDMMDAWKFVGRLDDRITLANGEKVLPLPMEGRIRQNSLVKEAVIFGIGRDIPGLLVFRSLSAAQLSNEEFVSAIWPTIADANSHAEAFSQISRDLIISMQESAAYPQTDKGTIIRDKVYTTFASQIDQAYRKINETSDTGLILMNEQLEDFLMEICSQRLEVHLPNAEADFFSAGVDSLKAIQLIGEIKKGLYLGTNGSKLHQNVVYEKRNVVGLAHFISLLQDREQQPEDSHASYTEETLIQDLVQKYTSFNSFRARPTMTSSDWVVVC